MVTSVPSILIPPARSNTFRPNRQPLRRSSTLRLDSEKVHGPVSFLNPTRARYDQTEPPIPEHEPSPAENAHLAAHPASAPGITQRPTGFQAPQPALTFQWTSRNSRKGRQTLLLTEDDARDTGLTTPQSTATPAEILRNIGRMFTCCPIRDISYDVAILFTLGSAVWVLNGFFTVLPYTNPSSTFPGQALYGGGITAFVGIVIFLLSGYFLVLEAINEDRLEDFG